MSRRIEIELTSTRPDGTWTWRAAGAREPKGVLEGSLLPEGSKIGSVLKADTEVELDGITVLAVTTGKDKAEKSGLLDLIPSDKPFEGVTQQLARGERADRGDRRDRPRRDGGDGDRRPRRDSDRPPRRDGASTRPDRPSGDRPSGPRTGGERTGSGTRTERGPRPERRSRPNFTVPPELPQRPKPHRLKPGRAHRSAILADLPEEQRPVAERALQGGLPAVRQAVNEQNARLKAEGKPEVPAAGLLSMAEGLLPRLRVAEWLDRADAAKADIDELDLRDLRSVVAAGEDPMVARDESTREIANELKAALVSKQESELRLWFEDIDAAISVGRVIRALKLSSQPPKAGVRFPSDLALKLTTATTANLTAEALPDRWVAVLEAAAFSPVRAQVMPTAKPNQVTDELLATVKRVSSLLPQIAALFEVEVTQRSVAPKPLRPTRPTTAKKAPPPKAPAAERRKPDQKPAKPEPAVTEPEATEPEPTTEPDATEPEAAQPQATEPEQATEPDAAEAEATEPEPTTEPEAAAKPEATEPEAAEPEATEPEATEPEAAEPEPEPATEPEATEPEVRSPEASEPEGMEPVTQDSDVSNIS